MLLNQFKTKHESQKHKSRKTLLVAYAYLLGSILLSVGVFDLGQLCSDSLKDSFVVGAQQDAAVHVAEVNKCGNNQRAHQSSATAINTSDEFIVKAASSFSLLSSILYISSYDTLYKFNCSYLC